MGCLALLHPHLEAPSGVNSPANEALHGQLASSLESSLKRHCHTTAQHGAGASLCDSF